MDRREVFAKVDTAGLPHCETMRMGDNKLEKIGGGRVLLKEGRGVEGKGEE